MPVDASIYSLLKPPIQVADPLEQYGKTLGIQSLIGQQGLQDLQTQQIRKGIADDDRIAGLFANGGKPTDEQLLGVGKAGLPYIKQRQETRKTEGEIQKTALESLGKSLSIHRDGLANVNDPQAAAQWVMAGFNDPLLSPIMQRSGSPQEAIRKIPTDPQGFQQWKMQNGLGIEKFMEITAPKIQMVGNGQTQTPMDFNARSPGYNVASVQMQATPGEVMVDARGKQSNLTAQGQLNVARDRLNFERNNPTRTYDAERGVLVDTRGGTASPVMSNGLPLQPKEKLNVEQGRAQLFGTRAAEADNILRGLEDNGTTDTGIIRSVVSGAAGMTPFVGDKMASAASSGMNTLPGIVGGPSDEQQQTDQARRDFVNAVLRIESGAVINPDEFNNAQKQYFPQPGDSEAVIKQKRANRQSAIEGLSVMSGPAKPRIDAARARAKPDGRTSTGKIGDAAVRINGDDGFNALPKGARYVGPDGVERTKP